MNENNSEEMEKKDVTEEVQSPEIKEEINVEENIEKNVKENVENKKVVNKVENVERKAKEESKKEKSGDKIYVQYRKPSLFSGLLLIIIGALIATIAFLVWYLFNTKENAKIKDNGIENLYEETNDTQDSESVVPKELDLSLDGEFVTSLYEKVPTLRADILTMSESFVYSTEKKTQTDISTDEKMMFVIMNMLENGEYTEVSSNGIVDRLEISQSVLENGGKIRKYEKADVEKEYKSIFGSDKEILLQDIKIELYNYNAEYDSTDDCFYGHSINMVNSSSTPYTTKLDSVQKSEDNTEVYIYDYIIFGDAGSGYRLYSTYADVISHNYFVEETSDIYSEGKVKDEVFEKYKDKLIKYKHTFKIDDTGNYYWYSTEPVD